MEVTRSPGDSFLALVASLASPQRMRIVAALGDGRRHVSQLARDLQMSRPLLYLHLQKLQVAGVVQGSLELSSDGKAMKYFQVLPFQVELTPESIAQAAETLSRDGDEEQKEPHTE